MKVAVIGMGNMGSTYASMILQGKIPEMTLAAVTRIKPCYLEKIRDFMSDSVSVFESADSLFQAIDNNERKIDAVIITTPHYSHEIIAIKAFERGLGVLCDKPAGVYTRQARNMTEAYFKGGNWKSTWATDGGGVILNQCPHNLDLLQWICGMPQKIQVLPKSFLLKKSLKRNLAISPNK